MLGSLVLDGIGGEVNGTDFVTINNGCAMDRVVEFHEKLAQPASFSGTIGHSTILGFCTRPGHCGRCLEDQEIRLSPRKTA
jgi:hypothetical protein